MIAISVTVLHVRRPCLTPLSSPRCGSARALPRTPPLLEMASHALRLHPLLFSTAARPVPPKVRAGAWRSRPSLAVVRCSSAA
ncbi:hypothetical protein E2562_026668 [Oryza meyeriana var. granulata]|uniref:Uncharacterized protein n=1 Tax=Oryza meyeriana var. granulata TaxID=110450 RepID=A0A6G1C0L2_9ORYZ|nr:hypothetical protein E2562_026668 [Oryza meyeriana var. granulata]